MQRFLAYLEQQPKIRIFMASCFLVLGFGMIDYLTGPDLSVFIFYLIPVFLSTWFLNRHAGVFMSLLSALAWTLADRIYAGTIVPYWNLSMEVVFFLLVVYFLSVLKHSLEHEKQMARTDYLTGAVNSRLFSEAAEAEIARMRRYLHAFSAVYVDIDNFKSLNDTFGHHAGDELLRLVVKTIRDDIRASDIVARLGGDEFMILFPETDVETARRAIEKVRDRLMDMVQEKQWPVTFSFGMVTFREPPPTVDVLIKLTDNLMYKGKNNGKSTIQHEVYENGKLRSL